MFGLEEGLRSDLLSTIRVPKSFLFLTERLPKANYNPLKTKKIEKIKFLQTLAGYKDLSTNHSIAEDLTKETEGTEHYKKNKDYGKAYLPSVGKEAHSKYIMKIYGDRDKERRGRVAKLRTERSHETNISNIIFDDSTDYETKSIKQSIKARRLKNVETAEDKESIDTEILSKGKSSEQVPYRLPPYRAPYKVHNLNDDVVFEKQQPHQVRMRQIYGEKSLSSILNNSGVSVGKDSVHSMLRRHKNQVSGRSPSQE